MESAAAVPSTDEALSKEYYEILKIVGDFDGRLMTVKGWGVTLSLTALAWGFQHSHYGLFLVAAFSGLGFWLIEGTMKPTALLLSDARDRGVAIPAGSRGGRQKVLFT